MTEVNIDFATARGGISFGDTSQSEQLSGADALGRQISDLASTGMAGAVQSAAFSTNEQTGDGHRRLLNWGQQALVDDPTTAVNILSYGQDGAETSLLNSGSQVSKIIGNQA
ncbi:hypothetical protein [Amycolatopsis sp. NPDC057786]|uniref:hypothetical protein n=1 Tax=Amycolatopsis sp. NPDC057786 TaxID=3346250 RepID=UPI00367359AD